LPADRDGPGADFRKKPLCYSSSRGGRTVGEMSLIDGEPRSASVVADEPTTLVVLTAGHPG
jgi:CRP-like cAMP-binding protein